MASAIPPAATEDKSKNKRTVFVRNIDFTVDKSTLQASFEKYGPVANCFVVGQPGQRHQGYGFVQFKKFEAAEQAAKALNGSQLGKRSLQVDLHPTVSLSKLLESTRTIEPASSSGGVGKQA